MRLKLFVVLSLCLALTPPILAQTKRGHFLVSNRSSSNGLAEFDQNTSLLKTAAFQAQGVSINPLSGKVLVTVPGNPSTEILELDADLNFLRVFANPGGNINILHLAHNPVADTVIATNHCGRFAGPSAWVFDSAGNQIATINIPDGGCSALGVAVRDDGRYLLGARLGNGIFEYDSTNQFVRALGKTQSLVSNITGLAIQKSTGNIYVSTESQEIVVLDSGGTTVIKTITGNGLNGFHGLAFDDNENLYVANTASNNILVFDPAGHFVTSFPSGGIEPFQIAFYPGAPPPPSGLRARVGDQQVYLSWDIPLPPVEGFNVYASRFNGSLFIPLGTANLPGVLVTAPPFKVSSFASGDIPQNGQLYEFTVTSVESGVESANSTPAFAKPRFLPQPPPAHPLLFLHGIFADASTWDHTVGFLRDTLRWRPGGELSISSSGQVAPKSFDPQGDFFTVSFGDKLAEYPATTCGQRCGILRQADELKALIDYLPTNGVKRLLSVVAHSMGGLATRAYIEDPLNRPSEKIYQIVTYGTPHRGVNPNDLKSLLQTTVTPFIAGLSVILPSRGFADMDAGCGHSPSAFIQSLNPSMLPTDIRYTAVVGHNHDLSPDRNDDCLASQDGLVHTDGFVPIASADLSQTPALPAVLQPGGRTPIKVITTDRFHINAQTADYSTILCALGSCLQISVRSPVDIEVTAPDGGFISRQLAAIAGASYIEVEDEPGHTITHVTIPFPSAGNYTVNVVPKPGTSPTDTYTLEVIRDETTTTIAKDQRVQDIPPRPYVVTVLSATPIDIRPGDSGNSINPKSQGKIPVAILSTPTFDAPNRVDKTSLTFGRFGDEKSLAFCDAGNGDTEGPAGEEDVNGDGLLDLVCHFETQQAGFLVGDTQGVLGGKTVDGVPFTGTDSVRIIP